MAIETIVTPLVRVVLERGEASAFDCKLVACAWSELGVIAGDRVVVRAWCDVLQDGARTQSAKDARVGRLYVEHLLVQRQSDGTLARIRDLPPALGAIATARPYEALRGPSLLELPPHARPLDVEMSLAPTETFGIGDTDRNQHVTSSVYPRVLERVVANRLSKNGISLPLVREIDLIVHRSFFAGENAHIAVQSFALDGSHGGVASIAAALGETPRAYGRVLFA